MTRADIESGFTLYAEYPDKVISRLDLDSTLLLYKDIARSRIKIRCEPWGLYEKVTITSYDEKTKVSKIFGQPPTLDDKFVLFYVDNNSPITLTGNTNLKGHIKIPLNGVVPGQIGAVVFNGEPIEPTMISTSKSELPKPNIKAIATADKLLESAIEHIIIDSLFNSQDTVIVGKRIHIENNFNGSLQVFATDSITVGENVLLNYPSGLYSEKHISIGDRSVVNGYAIIPPKQEPAIMTANYVQSRLATVRGLVYVHGVAQLQGIISGTALLLKSVYFSPSGYYENMFYDVTILENSEMAWPFWIDGMHKQRKEAVWIE